MEFEDILYTPLDVPDLPEFDVNQLKDWLSDAYPKLKFINKTIADSGFSSENTFEYYPWNLTPIYLNMFGERSGWLEGFETIFPELVEHISNSYNLSLDDIGSVYLLPLKNDIEGIGFWHKDYDVSGLRVYFEYESFEEDGLLIKKCKQNHTVSNPHNFGTPISDETLQNDFEKEHKCKIKSRKQSFYLNNFNAVHTTNTLKESAGKIRIAAFITPRFDNTEEFMEKTKDLIMNSAEKYKEKYSVIA